MTPGDDRKFMLRALTLARRGMGHTRPNPPVGAVVVAGGEIVGEGWHKRAGGDHAEVAAIKNAAKRGAGTKGSSIYVTLEPCSKPGRVGACTDAIVAAGISRVVYAAKDPNPKNRGRAKRVLAKHGIECELAGDAALRREAEEIIRPFAKHVTTGLPYVTVKIAMSLDGRICDNWGDAKWVSSADARRFTSGELRETADAIMVGAETVRRDDPSLLSHRRRNDDLMRIIVSRSGRLPKSAKVFTDGAPNETIVFGDARKAIEELGRRGVMSVLCEGGLNLAVSLAEAGLVDEWLTVLAPKVIGTRHIGDATVIGRTSCLQG